METDTGSGAPMKAKAVLIDPASMRLVWMNEAALQGFPEGTRPADVPVEQAVQRPDQADLAELVRAVAETGSARFLHSGLVSTSSGSLSMLTSLYRLPDGHVLALTENAWLTERRGREARPSAQRRRGR